MTYNDIINVKDNLPEFMKISFPYTISKQIFLLNKEVKMELEFFYVEEKKALDRYAAKDENGKPKILQNGQIVFNSITDMQGYYDHMTELKNQEVRLEMTPVKIEEALIEGQTISAESLSNLEAFIEIVS